MRYFLRFGLALTVLLALALPARAQIVGPISITAVDADSCVTAGSCASFPMVGNAQTMDVSGTWVGTLTFEATVDDSNWRTVTVVKLGDGSSVTTTTANGAFALPNSGVARFRVRATAWTSGTASVSATRGFLNARLNPSQQISTPSDVYGPELAPALAEANWTHGTGWQDPIAGGVLLKNADGTGTQTPSAATNIEVGKIYKVTIKVSVLSVGTATYTLGGTAGALTLASAATYTEYILAATTGKLIITPSNTSRLTISEISISALLDSQTFTNLAAATVTAPVKITPPLAFEAQGWDTDDAVSRYARWKIDQITSGTTTVGSTYRWGWLDPVTGVRTFPMSLTHIGNLSVGDGTFALPSYSYGADTATGLYRVGSGIVGLAGGSTNIFRIYNLNSGGNTEFMNIGANNNLFRIDYGNTSGGTARPLRIDYQGSAVWSFAITTGALAGEAAGSAISKYKSVATAGWGIPVTYGYGTVDATVDARSAAVATYTVGAADGVFEVSGNVLVTASVTHSFSLDVSYTDEGNTARVLVLPVTGLTGAFVTSGLITAGLGAGPYEAAVMTIRCKAATAITIRPSSGGTYTSVTYNVAATIKQIG